MPRSSDYPGPLPDPPPELGTTSLPVIEDQRSWFRLHLADYSPIYFGRTGRNRFDAPDGEYGVLYLGDSLHCCFVETYGRSDRGERRIVTRQELAGRNLATVELSGALRVVDLTGAGLARIGADNRLGTGDYQGSPTLVAGAMGTSRPAGWAVLPVPARSVASVSGDLQPCR